MNPKEYFSRYKLMSLLGVFLLLLGISSTKAQYSYQVQQAIDSSSVRIGEVIQYAIQVQDNRDKLVVFPDTKDFSPLEVLKSSKIDTLDENDNYRLLKRYALTQFDTGHYYIPKQRIIIGDKSFFTDSLAVEIRDVKIDTSKVKLYDIKGLSSVEDIKNTPWKKILVWSIIIITLIVLTALTIWKFNIGIRKKQKDLPPFEKAIKTFEELDPKLIVDKQYKTYYSIVTETAKKYLDSKVIDNAMESTTDELVQLLSNRIEKRKLFVKKEHLKTFEEVFRTADLAKFAAINPPEGVAESHKEYVRQFLIAVNEGLPEPTEEELLKDENYRKEKARKEGLMKQRIILVSSLVILCVGISTYLVSDNFHNIKSYILDKSGSVLLHSEWNKSTYGVPGVSMSSPMILSKNIVELSSEEQQMFVGKQVYTYGNLIKKFNVIVNTVTFRQDFGFTVDAGMESIYNQLEEMGAKNILVKVEDFETISGTEGGRAFGSFDFTIPKTNIEVTFEYTVLQFAEGQGAQQVIILFEKDDDDARQVMERIVKSVEILKN